MDDVGVSENCRDRNRLITSEKGDLYALIDGTLGEKLILQCHYCRELDDIRPKIWYSIDVFGITEPKEVKIDMANECSSNRIQIAPDHSLNIDNFTQQDTGVYFCIGLEDQDKSEKINYLVDLVEKENMSDVESGNLTKWLKYHEDNMFPINYLFKNSLSPEYVFLRETLKLSLELKTDWDPWGPCEVCGRLKGQGIKTRKGRCRIKIQQIQKHHDLNTFTADEIFLMNAFEISCRSILLQRLTPTIFNSIRVVHNFNEIQSCEGICNPDAEGKNAGWKVGKTKYFKYRKTVVLLEGDHLTLICPESSLENRIIWKRNGKELKRWQGVELKNSKEEPRILVDTFGTLYLVEVRNTEEGNYTCTVDDIKMEQVVIFITSKSKLLTELFLRHLWYLGFVLSLTSTCYVGGLIIACKKKYTFKTYKMLKETSKQNILDNFGDDYD